MPAEINKTNNQEGFDLPIRQAIIIIEHKIRNLEKRKNKLESYRSIQFSGKELSSDQKTAVAKYNEVAQSLELARDFVKQLVQLSSNYEKEVKKQSRKDALIKAQQETAKIREVLILQETLNIFDNEESWNDFAFGLNGAIQLDKKELDLLKKFNSDVKTGQILSSETSDIQTENFQKVAEYLSMTVDGRSRVYYDDFTFENIKELLDKVRNSEYKPVTNEDSVNNNCNENAKAIVDTSILIQPHNGDEQNDSKCNAETFNIELNTEAPSATILPPPSFSNSESSSTNISNKIIEVENEKSNQIFTAVLENSSDHQQIKIRPLSEVIGDGNFYFIQDSEIDIPEIEQDHKIGHYNVQKDQIQTIQSQTFTNQSMISTKTQNSFERKTENNVNVHENIENATTTEIVKVDSPNASNLPMPGFPALGKSAHEDKHFQDNSGLDVSIDWKSQVNECEKNKWSSPEDYKSSTNQNFPKTNMTDRNGNASRSQFKHNVLRGNGHNYFKNNDVYYQTGSATNAFRSRGTRDRGNSYSSRSQK